MRHRSPARWLAPLALVTCAVAVYVVVDRGLDTGPADSSTRSEETSTTRKRTATTTTKRKAPSRPRTYTVKAGDVLSAIAEKTGVSVAELENLNPSVDAASLRPGQKLKLR